MQPQRARTLSGLLASILLVGVVLTAQSPDRVALTSANGIAFSEFGGYDAWQLVATSQPGCGYATFVYDATCDAFKPATTNPSFAQECDGCHTAHAKARDFVFTAYAKR